MRDENHCEAELLVKSSEEQQNFPLRGGVEGCGRFIGNDQGRPASDSLADEHTLALSSAQFVRIGAGNAFGACGKHRREKLAGLFP